jgi:hypothetical protein
MKEADPLSGLRWVGFPVWMGPGRIIEGFSHRCGRIPEQIWYPRGWHGSTKERPEVQVGETDGALGMAYAGPLREGES